MNLPGTNISKADAGLIAMWVGIPAAVRYLIVLGTIAGFGWTARGTFSELTGLTGRVAVLELDVRQLREDSQRAAARTESILMYLTCRSVEVDRGRPSTPCTHYVRGYPDIYDMLTR
jgi:hypothetical protein